MKGIDREILRLSLPTIVSNITVPLLGICDTAISGHLGSELFLSAIAVASVMLNVVFWIFGFLRGGTTGLTANALGAGSQKEISKVFYRSLIIALGAGILLIIFRLPVFRFLWWIAGAGPEIRPMVEEYYEIRILGAPALLSTMAISGWFVGMQTTFYPMVIAILMNVINIIASYTLAFPLGVGFNGVAYGTLISNWLGLAISVGCVIWFLKGRALKFILKEVIKGKWVHYFSVNGNLFLRSFFIICVTMGVTSAGARLGNFTLAVNVIIMQYFQFFSFFMDGFAFSGEAMVGLRCGEGNLEELKISVRRLLQWTLWVGLSFTALYLIGIQPITELFTDNMEVVEGVVSMRIWVALLPIVSCWAFIYDGYYIGITATYRMMLSTLIGGILFFLIIGYNYIGDSLPASEEGNRVIWAAFLSYLLGRGLYLSGMWGRSLKEKTGNKKIFIQ